MRELPIPEYEGYFANEVGDIISYRSGKRIVLSQFIKNDYNYVQIICADGIQRQRRSHRLSCMAFYGLPKNLATNALHKDDNKRNNHISNLYWGTKQQNRYDMMRNMPSLHKSALTKMHTARRIISDDDLRIMIARFNAGESAVTLAAERGVNKTYIYTAIKTRGASL